MRSNRGRVLITGANGMLATNLIDRLIAQGYSVRGVLRSRLRYRGVEHAELELVECDFTDREAMASMVEGCDYVIHAAANTSQSQLDYELYRRVNVSATEQLVELSIACGVKRFVYVSTANTIGAGSPEAPSSEDTPIDSFCKGSMYARSKAEAEDIVLQMGDKIDVVVVNPTFMIGRYGTMSGSNRIFSMVKPMMFVPNGGKSFIDVEEAARATLFVMEHGQSGLKYLVCGDNLSYKEFFSRFSQVRHIFVLPKFILMVAGALGSMLRQCGVACDMSYANAKLLTNNVGYSNARLVDLGFDPKGLKRVDEYL